MIPTATINRKVSGGRGRKKNEESILDRSEISRIDRVIDQAWHAQRQGKNLEAFVRIDDLTSAGDLRPERRTGLMRRSLASANDTLSEMRPARVQSDSRWKIAMDWSQRRLFPASFA